METPVVDRYVMQARGLVGHCRFCDRDYKCPDDYASEVDDVAAALRAQGLEIERLKAQLAKLDGGGR